MVGGNHAIRRALVLTALALLALPATAGATFPGDNGLIAFENNSDGGIYTIKANGSGRDKLADGFEPSWSANGEVIVYAAEPAPLQDTELFTMKANGRHKHRITRDNRYEWEPAFSPSGRRIAFRIGQFRNGSGKIYVIGTDGHHRRKLSAGESPDWSAPIGHAGDGLIAYAGYDSPDPCFGTVEIFTQTPAGKHQKLLPFGCHTSFLPSWSPNARKLAFNSYPPVGNSDIYIGPRSGDGTAETKLTDLPNQDEGAAWSPDGAKVAFGDQDNGLYIVDVDTPLVETQIPNTADVDGAQPSWQPK